MSRSPKLKKIFNYWKNKKKGFLDHDLSLEDNRDIGLSRRRAHQKLLEYEIEILQSKLRKSYQELGESVFELLLENKKVQKSAKKIKPTYDTIKKKLAELKGKQQEKNLDFDHLINSSRNENHKIKKTSQTQIKKDTKN